MREEKHDSIDLNVDAVVSSGKMKRCCKTSPSGLILLSRDRYYELKKDSTQQTFAYKTA